MNFCKDCQYYRRQFLGEPRCSSPRNGTDSVTGLQRKSFCDIAREFRHLCGPEAKWFKPAEQGAVWRITGV